jgi:hypothetical protein
VARESGNLTVLLRTLGENNMRFYDLADDVEDLSEDFVDLSKSTSQEMLFFFLSFLCLLLSLILC